MQYTCLPRKSILWAKVSSPLREHFDKEAILLTLILTLEKQDQQSSCVRLVPNKLNKSLLNTQFRKTLSPVYGDGHQPTPPPQGIKRVQRDLSFCFSAGITIWHKLTWASTSHGNSPSENVLEEANWGGRWMGEQLEASHTLYQP